MRVFSFFSGSYFPDASLPACCDLIAAPPLLTTCRHFFFKERKSADAAFVAFFVFNKALTRALNAVLFTESEKLGLDMSTSSQDELRN